MKLLKSLEKSLNCWFLIAISFIFFLLRLPSLYEPIWYGDEGIYQTLGLGINSGKLLYKDIFDNKPPLLYLFYSFVNSDQFLIRLLSLIFGLFAIWGFYILSKKILTSSKSAYISTGFFAVLFAIPLIEGNIANAENFMLLLNIISGIIILKALEKNKLLLFSISGLILGISFLFKIVALFDFAAFFIFVLIADLEKISQFFNKTYLETKIKSLSTFTLSFFIPILLTTIYFTINNSLQYFLKAVLFNNIGYVEYGNKLIIPQGFLILKITLLLLFLLFIFLKRHSLGKQFIFAGLWIAFSLFNAFFSQRPYTHYVLVLLPSFCLMIGLIGSNNKAISKLSGVLTLSVFIVVLLNFGLYMKTFTYYQNFISFIIGTKNVKNYQRYFDSNTPRDYEIASYISTHTDKKSNIFVWGNNAQIYNLTGKLPPGRYTVAYHINNYKDGLENTFQNMIKTNPKLIVVMPNVPSYPFSLSNYDLKIILNGVKIYEKFN